MTLFATAFLVALAPTPLLRSPSLRCIATLGEMETVPGRIAL